jgi:NAD-dependent deacetylase
MLSNAIPRLVWEWYAWRRNLVAQAKPNAGHRALAELETRTPKFTLITQNVDDLHERAGSRNVLHVHGSIWTTCCVNCKLETIDMHAPLPEIPPRCANCGGLLRPGVVWFGESLPRVVWEAAEEAACTADMFLVVGTSALVYPAAGLAQLAKSRGSKIIVVNLDQTELSGAVNWFLQGPAGEILPKLLD